MRNRCIRPMSFILGIGRKKTGLYSCRFIWRRFSKYPYAILFKIVIWAAPVSLMIHAISSIPCNTNASTRKPGEGMTDSNNLKKIPFVYKFSTLPEAEYGEKAKKSRIPRKAQPKPIENEVTNWKIGKVLIKSYHMRPGSKNVNVSYWQSPKVAYNRLWTE